MYREHNITPLEIHLMQVFAYVKCLGIHAYTD